MPGGARGTIEQVMQESVAGKGYREDWSPGLGGWRSLDGLSLTAATAPAIAAEATSLFTLVWDAALLVTDVITFPFTMPQSYAEHQYDLQIVCVARKASNANADLAIQAQVHWFTPGIVNTPNQQTTTATQPTLTAGDAGLSSLTTPARALLTTGGGSSSDTIGYGTYLLDIGARLAAESKQIQAGDACLIRVGPHETAGDDLRMHPPIIRWRRHAGLRRNASSSQLWDPRNI